MPGVAGAASAASAPDAGRAWEPPTLSEPLYRAKKAECVRPFAPADEATGGGLCGVKAIAPDETFRVAASDGESIYVDVWLPKQRADGPPPPKRLPVVATISPYHHAGSSGMAQPQVLVPYGYAVAQVHMRGTGRSTGCFEAHSRQDADDGARVVQALADAAWSTGRVALMGLSHNGGAAMNVAARGDSRRLRGLRALVPVSPFTSVSDIRTRDGVLIGLLPVDSAALSNVPPYTTFASYENIVDGYVPDATERGPCRLDHLRAGADLGGGPNAWELERELRPAVGDIRVPTLYTMGLQELQMRNIPGLFERIGTRAPGRVRKVGLFGQWGHHFPDRNSRVRDWARADWEAILVAWLDRWLRGAENGVEDWPTVQVQDTTGQWRTEPEFPRTGGPVGQLALGPDGLLGTADPSGSDVLSAGSLIAPRVPDNERPDTALTWQTETLDSPLRIVGVPVLDLWVRLEKPAGQLVAELLAVTPEGRRIALNRRLGARSLRYLDPIRDDHFIQSEPRAPAVETPLRVLLRFDPADMVLPAGTRLQLKIGTMGPAFGGEMYWVIQNYDASMTGADAEGGAVTILHSCEYPSALRFLMPRSTPDLIDVREHDQTGELGQSTEPTGDWSGGIATESVCEQPPVRLESFGSEIKSSSALRRLGARHVRAGRCRGQRARLAGGIRNSTRNAAGWPEKKRIRSSCRRLKPR